VAELAEKMDQAVEVMTYKKGKYLTFALADNVSTICMKFGRKGTY